jgi:deazaflavin-dependent oxidoreductase (nitroreductase family)
MSSSLPSRIELKTVKQFPVKGTALATILENSNGKSQFHKQIESMNKFMILFYRLGVLPIFGISKTLMLLKTKGRKSHKTRYFPVGYICIEKEIYLISAWGKESNWYKNIITFPDDVGVKIGYENINVVPRIVDDETEKKKLLLKLITKTPNDAKRLFGWNPDKDKLEDSDFSPIIQNVMFVNFIRK